MRVVRFAVALLSLALADTATCQAVHAKHLLTTLGGGAGLVTVERTVDELATDRITCGSAVVDFSYAIANRWSLGVHYARIGSDRTDNSIELLRFSTYMVQGVYRPWIGERATFEAYLAAGPSLMAMKPFGENLPLRGRNTAVSLGIRYVFLFGGTLGAFISAEHTAATSMTVTDYDGQPIETANGDVVRADWHSQRINAGLLLRF